MAQPYWVREHVRRYRESAGTDGHGWRGLDGKQQLPCLLLTTTGRRSGDAHSTPLIYGQHGDRFVILASRGGSDRDPQWYGVTVRPPGDDGALVVGAPTVCGEGHPLAGLVT